MRMNDRLELYRSDDAGKSLDECDGMLGIEIEDGLFVAQFMLPLDD